ncbi:FecCD family ABC transporter permease [Clostridium cadaveris]|uniref:FecCD family ABC transporter permease n=1 Tax=Clostridium cadaveris TaxID=1529 RepID=UPI001FAC0AC3|nr:iron ABC transporter permease [Clostridium cadaveris]
MKTKMFNKRARFIMLISLILLAVSAIFAIGIGSVYIEPAKVVETLIQGRDAGTVEATIIYNMRLTRVIASIFGGAALALSGLLLQILFNNPIADPYILGISSGARLFVGLVLLGGVTFGLNTTNPWFLFLGALIGSLVVMMLILAFASKLKNITTLLIVGTMLGYLCSSLIGFLVAFSDDNSIADFTKWGMGSFGLMTWSHIYVLVAVCITLFILSFMLSKSLNSFLLGEAYAKTMGVNTKALRVLIIVFSSVLTAVVTAFAGLIAFVGMSVPHICRLLLKSEDARTLIPTTLVIGALFGVACDLIARTIVAPSEIAVGTITSVVGVPIVLYLLMKRNKVRI